MPQAGGGVETPEAAVSGGSVGGEGRHWVWTWRPGLLPGKGLLFCWGSVSPEGEAWLLAARRGAFQPGSP